MIKTLTKHGNSMALVIERPILKLLGASADTVFEMATDGKSLVLTPIRDGARREKLHRAMEKIGRRYAGSFEELAK